jgi:outer membrane biosynthesis protein TonB
MFAAIDINAGQKDKAAELPPDSIVVPHDKPPKLIHEKNPEYPRLALEGGFNAHVRIKAFIDEYGEVAKAKVVSCDRPHMGFEESTLKAEYGCRYEPARQKKNPIGVWVIYEVKFESEKGIRRGPIHSHKLK